MVCNGATYNDLLKNNNKASLSRAHMSAKKCNRIVSHELLTKIKPLVGRLPIHRSVQSINFVYYIGTMYTDIL